MFCEFYAHKKRCVMAPTYACIIIVFFREHVYNYDAQLWFYFGTDVIICIPQLKDDPRSTLVEIFFGNQIKLKAGGGFVQIIKRRDRSAGFAPKYRQERMNE